MRWAGVLLGIMLGVLAVAAFAGDAGAQSSTTTACVMTCNSQAATCQSACFLPPSPPLGSTTPPLIAAQSPGANVSQSTTCTMNCTNTQLQCQTQCARSASQGLQLTAPPTPTAGTQQTQ